MTSSTLTLMTVHAHPDDEASSTGGILAKYSAEGLQTVVVTCTNGEMGDGPNGVKPGEPGHDEDEVMALRRAELEKSCAILGVTHLEVLGFRDSGMAGWESNDHPAAFSRQDPSEAARPLASLMQLYRPQVVVTYDDFGFYGHPDHIQAHFVTVAALDLSGLQAKLYCPTVRRSLLGEFARRLTEAGIEPPTFDSENFGSPDEDVVATVDCEAYAEAKRRALAAHSSQTDNSFFLELPEDVFVDTFATEEFIRLRDPVSSPPPESDLFAGYRGACGEGTPD